MLSIALNEVVVTAQANGGYNLTYIDISGPQTLLFPTLDLLYDWYLINFSNDDDDNETCNLSVSLSSIDSEIVPGGSVILTANIQQTGSPSDLKYFYEAYYSDQWWELSDPNNCVNNNLEYKMKVLGAIKFRVKVTYKCGQEDKEITSEEVSTNSKFCLSDLNSQFGSNMDAAWNSTVSRTNAGTGKYEDGFIVNFNGSIPTATSFQAQSDCDIVELSSITGIQSPTGNVSPNFIGYIWTVGLFHTHPPLTNCPTNYSLLKGPSSIDLSSISNFPKVVRTYDQTVSGGHDIDLPTMDTAYGPNCTTY
ncbi:hypothetical protein I5M32_11385 [Pedobacter sp. SD-b]|uniref:Uncharacterized protein n=1 Tax=Pedobacter segetis TaxID=2793069 RepID=A0ABS1BKZ5_9SPHI|nr:hypothetical protein [Pedobacter segetis]MBK0383560.1 hypothetical protein [Pedobacter segetis]